MWHDVWELSLVDDELYWWWCDEWFVVMVRSIGVVAFVVVVGKWMMMMMMHSMMMDNNTWTDWWDQHRYWTLNTRMKIRWDNMGYEWATIGHCTQPDMNGHMMEPYSVGTDITTAHRTLSISISISISTWRIVVGAVNRKSSFEQ